MPGSKHGRNKLSNYREVHSTRMHQLRAEGFVLDDGVEFQPYGSGYIVMAGRITCAGGIHVDVSKVLRVERESGVAWVQTIEYSYNAVLPGRGAILRYDSPHESHRPHHHVHRYDALAGDKDGTVDATSDTDWPTLGEVLTELRDWYYDNYERLGPAR